MPQKRENVKIQALFVCNDIVPLTQSGTIPPFPVQKMHALPGMVIDAYVRESYFGNTLDLMEPGFGRAIAPYIINNKSFPADWFEHTINCDKLCHKCGYCKSVLKTVLFNTKEQ